MAFSRLINRGYQLLTKWDDSPSGGVLLVIVPIFVRMLKPNLTRPWLSQDFLGIFTPTLGENGIHFDLHRFCEWVHTSNIPSSNLGFPQQYISTPGHQSNEDCTHQSLR